jgi:hypothetical protein
MDETRGENTKLTHPYSNRRITTGGRDIGRLRCCSRCEKSYRHLNTYLGGLKNGHDFKTGYTDHNADY